MTPTARRTILWVTALIGTFVGAWAAFAPHSFHESFPGLGRVWVAIDGPYNEHLVRDVGALYLALAAASVSAAVLRTRVALVAAGRVVGVAWIVFSVPHLAYHLRHLGDLSTGDVAEVAGLTSTILLGTALLLPDRAGRH